jgi:hypothetical protein
MKISALTVDRIFGGTNHFATVNVAFIHVAKPPARIAVKDQAGGVKKLGLFLTPVA